jgi:hypothetical protein
MNVLSKDSRYHGRSSNQGPPEYEAGRWINVYVNG